MAICNSNPIGIGRDLIISWSAGCGVDDPNTLTYSPLGFVESRTENSTPRTVTSNTDSSGIYTDTSVIGNDIEISVTALDAKDAPNKSSQQELRRYYRNELLTGNQPTMWVRVTDPLLAEYRYYFAVPTSLGRSAENESNRASDFTFTAKPTYSDSNPTMQVVPFDVPPPEDFTWFDKITGLVDCSYGLIECNSEQIPCL